MSLFPIFDKDPDSVLDYMVDWTAWLDGDLISASIWEVTGTIEIEADSETTTTATVWLSGGTAGETATATNRITTAAGRTEDQTLRFRIREH